jgi:hypothetical protein
MVANDFMGPTLYTSERSALVDQRAVPGCEAGGAGGRDACFLTH